jgi:hypothetical protein
MFGDLKIARGDETCLYFGEEFTPNHHRLAREFEIYDNFDTGESLTRDPILGPLC